ncbi:MAG: hypothetical protein ACLGSD_17645 [Acidobacteriota bacterium]
MKAPRTSILLSVLALMAILVPGSTCARAQSQDSEKINELFHSIRQHAVMAEADAELLESYTRSSVSWESHSRRIESMRSHVKDLADDYNEASALRAEGSPWQQDAIDHLQPLLQGMADHMKATIDHLKEHPNKTRMQPWIDYVRANRDYAVRTTELIRDYVNYGEAKATADELEKKLQIPESAGDA